MDVARARGIIASMSQLSIAPLAAFLVEDNRVIRENLAATLEEMAPVRIVGTAADEPAAVAWLTAQDQPCDLVVVDLFLARGSGFDVLQAVRHLRRASAAIVLTNYATPDVRRRCVSLGAERVFDKSHEIEALIDYCRQLALRRSVEARADATGSGHS